MFKRYQFSLRHSIFLRLIMTFLLIMLPIWLLGIYMYTWIVQTARENISQTSISQIAYYLSDMENEIERIKMLEYSLLEDDDLNGVAFKWEAIDLIDRTVHINSLLKRLYTIENSSMYIKNVSVHIAAIEKTISIDGVGPLDEEHFMGIRSIYGQGSQIIEWQGELYLSASKPYGIREGRPLFSVEIELEKDRLREDLYKFNTYPDSGALLLYEHEDVTLSMATDFVEHSEIETLLHKVEEARHSNSNLIERSGEKFYFLSGESDKLDFTVYHFFPERIFSEPLGKIYAWGYLFIAISLGIIAIYAVSTYQFIHKPLLIFVNSFQRMADGDLDVYIRHDSKDEFRSLYALFNQMTENLRSLIDQVYKQKILAQRAELKQLQSQINPHFLYNSFFILNTMAKTGDVERIEQFTTILGEYFQFVTRNAADNISLEQEIRYARMYTDIQELRFSRRIRVRFDPLPAQVEAMLVPRLIVQPVIENAFEHSLEKRARDGYIVIRYEVDEHEVRIIVEDNGTGLTDEALGQMSQSLEHVSEEEEITGLVNIHRRIQITFMKKGKIQFSRSELGGLKAIIRLPREGGESHV